MYYLLGIDRNIETNILLSSLGGRFPQSTTELKFLYREYLKSIQDQVVVSHENKRVELVWNEPDARSLIKLFGVKSELNDLDQEHAISKNYNEAHSQVKANTEASIQAMEKLDPVLYNLFQLTIEKVFYAGSVKAGGGSSSAAIGCIWLNSRATWTEQDYLEFFVHELTHNLVFLDERREVHYPRYDLLEKTENFAYSAILRRARPLDKTVHSLFVVFEVLAFRLKHFNIATKTFLHPDTQTLIAGAEDTIRSLALINPILLSDHLKELVSKLDIRLRKLKKEIYASEKLSYV